MDRNDDTRIAAIVPMRHSSERVPGKNYRPFAGKPLYHYIISTLLATPQVTTVVIDTDSSFIMEDAARHFPGVVVLERPEHLRAGEIPMNDVLLNTIMQVPADLYLQTHSTNPLLRTETVEAAIQALVGSREHDSLFSVTKLQTRLWDEHGKPINHNPSVLLRTQDLPPVFEENSNIYLFARETLETRGNRIGERPLMFEVDAAEAWDIDEELDFLVAEFLYKQRRAEKELG
ncbi:MAG: acylneuraminate cytidylyltransferase family protein [Candidatus Aquicultorales bacterium]